MRTSPCPLPKNKWTFFLWAAYFDVLVLRTSQQLSDHGVGFAPCCGCSFAFHCVNVSVLGVSSRGDTRVQWTWRLQQRQSCWRVWLSQNCKARPWRQLVGKVTGSSAGCPSLHMATPCQRLRTAPPHLGGFWPSDLRTLLPGLLFHPSKHAPVSPVVSVLFFNVF